MAKIISQDLFEFLIPDDLHRNYTNFIVGVFGLERLSIWKMSEDVSNGKF